MRAPAKPPSYAGDDERQCVDVVEADADELRRDGLLRDSARRDAEFGAIEKVEQHHHGNNRANEDKYEIAAHHELAEIEDAAHDDGIVLRHAVGRMDDDLLGQEEHANGRHQRREWACQGDEPKAEPVDQQAEEPADRRGHQKGGPGRPPD